MRTYDFSPLYRSTVGFDRLFDMLDQSARAESPPNWPPYNIERASEDDYRITMALAGFSPDEIELVQKENTLVGTGEEARSSFQSTLIRSPCWRAVEGAQARSIRARGPCSC